MTERIIPNADLFTGWRKSSYSGNDGASCLEVRDNDPRGIPVRDSKVPHGPAVVFSAPCWSSFISTLKTIETG